MLGNELNNRSLCGRSQIINDESEYMYDHILLLELNNKKNSKNLK